MQYVCTLSKSDYQFTKFDYVCLRAIFQDHYVMAFPSIHLFLAGNYRLLNTHLLELVNRFSNNPIIQRRCIHIIINLMETARIIDSHQVSQLHGLCQSNDPKMYSQFLLFREKSDISAFFNCMKNRITASPLQPPRCSLRLSQSSWSNIPHADFALVQSGIRVIAMREGGKISSEECLNRLYRLLHPSGSSDVSIGDRELSFSFFVPSQMDYPRNELYQLIRMGAFSTNEQSYLYYKCRESSLSLALCYCSYAQTGNQSQFDELCKMCMEVWSGPWVFLESHSKILRSLLTSQLIDTRTLAVIQREYTSDYSNIFYQAFSIAEKDKDMPKFASALKKLVSLYSI